MQEQTLPPKESFPVDNYSIQRRLARPQLEGTWVTAPLIRIHDLLRTHPICKDYEESRRRPNTLKPINFTRFDKVTKNNSNSKARKISVQFGDAGYDFPPHVPVMIRQEQQMIDSTICDSIQCGLFFPWQEKVSQGYDGLINQVVLGVKNEQRLRGKKLSLHYVPWQYQFDWVLKRVVQETGKLPPVTTLFYTENSLVKNGLVVRQSYWQSIINSENDNLYVNLEVCDEGKLARVIIGKEVNRQINIDDLQREVVEEKAVLLEYNLDEDSKLKGKLQFAMSGTKVRRLTPDRLIMDQIKIPITQQPEGIVYLFIPSEINTESLFRNIKSGKSGLSFRTDVPYNG